MTLSLRGTVAAPGTIRRYWRQAVNLIAAQGPYSWTASANDGQSPQAVGITRALRYMTRSVGHTAGTDNTRFSGLHTTVTQQGRRRETVTLGAGRSRGKPTIRNRLTSFGSRVPPLNPQVQADQGAQQ